MGCGQSKVTHDAISTKEPLQNDPSTPKDEEPADEPLANTASEPSIPPPTYLRPRSCSAEKVVEHLLSTEKTYYKKLKDDGFTAEGEKTIKDQYGYEVVVTGSLFQGNLVGFGDYVDQAGNKWKACFNDDVKHGVQICNQTNGMISINTCYEGKNHGAMTVHKVDGNFDNVWWEEGTETKRLSIDAKNSKLAFFERDGSPNTAVKQNPASYCDFKSIKKRSSPKKVRKKTSATPKLRDRYHETLADYGVVQILDKKFSL